MANIIILSIFGVVLLLAFTGAIGALLAGEKGYSTTKGLLIGMTIFGLAYLVQLKTTNEVLVKELYSRELISKEEYDKTMEIALKK